ncbi:carbamoyl-phosphate synthase large subunit [Coxiella endosymbiont of Amblyomma americanum]|uniref:carbamoyl-phosphate synthase large subunit n=1 Tax=Coxiella endosymbiont of Amblyomma americanum TaxID=325775 RepID=UPI00057DEFF9|nr:carbamoyl-phosphate synthase large subunit [Coxiella endosymbiont of Amblyomma americanum]AJC50510.1 carbamoyl phosphate synthase large subunit [Coxiella endosymbiont of Amblyomma americanum]AUJ58845.1 carbamoyl phosphate synthase large subunit [Coxiella-like endosymbiont of Amblyomma americanum]
MPKRKDIKRVLIIGAGPIVIGQACEFDYSGTQACRALREEGCYVILVNSNPATIMTDPNVADATYIEPISWEVISRIIKKERPDAILPTMGGQTGLNCALDLVREGILEKYKVQLIGASREAIDKAEDRALFQKAMAKIGLETTRSGLTGSMEGAWQILDKVGFPVVIRLSFTLGGSGGGIAYNRDEFLEICTRGFELSPTNTVLIDESIVGWKEFELEVIRDIKDNCIVVCSIENIDPVGIHTGDSITVAPAQTLTDKEYQRMRNAAIAILREIGVETGGSNVQFAINPEDGRMVVIEMNPRVSRSSVLASKATGFPIAKVAAKLAIGCTLDELRNEITGGKIPVSFEPSIDYIVTKIPRFNFEKFPQTQPRLTTQMQSVGEVMAIGRTFQESLQKAIRGLEINICGLESKINEDFQLVDETLREEISKELRFASPERLWYLADAFRVGFSLEEIYKRSQIDRWFLAQIEELVWLESKVKNTPIKELSYEKLLYLKRKGFSDRRLAQLLSHTTEENVRNYRHKLKILPVYKRVDTCAAEFSVNTDYFYSTYEEENECLPTKRNKIIVLGSGPNRIGQGIEFDYCCVHAALAMRDVGYESVMVNCNPETVSTDFDISDRLYFESLTLEDVLEIVKIEKPKGIIVQFGGQTPLKLAGALEKAKVPILGTQPDAIDRAEDRERFQMLIRDLRLQQPPNGTVRSVEEGLRLAKVFAYPLIARPSYVLGGRAMRIIYSEKELTRYMTKDVIFSKDEPLLLDRFLEDAIEVDVDAVCDGENILICGILEHIEQAGVHSGDSSCAFPPHSLNMKIQDQLREQVFLIAKELNVIGLINTQFAIQGNEIYVLEVNPRASRTIPFLAKATGLPLIKIAALCMISISLKEQAVQEHFPRYFFVKKPVFPFNKFSGVDPILGPEMRSTGEAMGIGENFGQAFAKGQLAGGDAMPREGRAFLSVRDADKGKIIKVASTLVDLGFEIISTRGTARALQKAGIFCTIVNKVTEGRPHIVDMIKNDQINFIINTTEGEQAIEDSNVIRISAVQHKVCYTTTLAGGEATVLALRTEGDLNHLQSLQELHRQEE